MARLSQIRTGIQGVVRAGWPDLLVQKYLQTSSTPPALLITLSPKKDGEIVTFSHGRVEWYFILTILVSRTAAQPEMEQEDLDNYIDWANPQSIPRLLWDNKDLGLGDETECSVVGIYEYGGEYISSGDPRTGAEIRLRVVTNAT